MNRAHRSACLAIAAAILSIPGPAAALGQAYSDDGDSSVEAAGSVRLTGAYLRLPDAEGIYERRDDSAAAAVIRAMLDGAFTSGINFELNLFGEVARTPFSETRSTFGAAVGLASTYRFSPLELTLGSGEAATAGAGVDRANVRFTGGPLSITVGRFPINHSVTRVFAPNDFFAPYSLSAINKIYKPGVDAVGLAVATGAMSSIELVAVMGYTGGDSPSFSRSALLARAGVVLWDFEWALLGGKLAERWIAGASFQGDAGRLGLRGEGHVGFPDSDGDGRVDRDAPAGFDRDALHVRLSVGTDAIFEWHNSTIGAEYAFYSDGASPGSYAERAVTLFPDDQVNLGGHYVGASASTEIIPILRGSVLALLNAVDLSGLASASLILSVADEVDLVAGVLVPWGERPRIEGEGAGAQVSLPSEYGAAPFIAYVESRFYF